METRILYKIDAQGKVRCWQGRVSLEEDGTAYMYHISGLRGGVQSSTPIHVQEGKNVGKKNETSPYDQAIKNINAAYDKKLREGYVLDVDSFDRAGVMLATNAHAHMHNLPALSIAQPKIDGVRVLVRKKDGDLQLISKSNQEHPEFLQETVWATFLHGFMVDNQEFDGEMYIHGLELPDITSLVRSYSWTTRELHARCTPIAEGTLIRCTKKELSSQVFTGPYTTDYIMHHCEPMYKGIFVPFHISNLHTVGTMDLELWIFDAPSSDTTEERMAYIQSIRDIEEHSIRIVPCDIIETSRVGEYNDVMLEVGFEGTMLRNPSTPYEYNKRSNGLQKYKTFIDSEFVITGIDIDREGNPNLTFLSEAGYPFKARPVGNRTFRARLLRDRELIIGKSATLRYQKLHQGTLKPQFARVVDIRDYE